MPIACKICILTKGLKGSEIASLPQTEEEFYEHLRVVHGITVRDPPEEPKPGPHEDGSECHC